MLTYNELIDFLQILSIQHLKSIAGSFNIELKNNLSKNEMVQIIIQNRKPINIENSIDTNLVLQLVARHGFNDSRELGDFLQLALLNKKFKGFIRSLEPQKAREMRLIENLLLQFDPDEEYQILKYVASKGCTKLMFLILNEKKIKYNFHWFLSNYIKEHPTELDAKNSEGYTALIMASRNSNTYSSLETVKVLIDAGVDVNLRNDNSNTALMYSSLETVKVLIDAGADVNVQNDYGETALMIASRYSGESSFLETVKVLIDAGSDVNLQDKYGETALMYISHNPNSISSLEIVKLLIHAGANVNLKDDEGWTALISTLMNYTNTYISSKIVKILIEAGADVNVQNNVGSTALMYASENPVLASILIDAGAYNCVEN